MAVINFEKIRAAITSSSVPGEDKKYLIDFFADIDDDTLSGIAELFETKPDWVEKFNTNRKKKNEAASTGNNALWKEILEEEKKYLHDLTFGLD